jgi:hypothetical protein
MRVKVKVLGREVDADVEVPLWVWVVLGLVIARRR